MSGSVSEVKEIVERVVARAAELNGVRAIVLGGSRARGTADAKSDVDLGIYYDPDDPFSVDELGRAAQELDDRHQENLLTPFGAWGPGVNGGGWLVVENRHVDFLYRDLRAVRASIDACLAGKPASIYQLGHPLGFHNQIYAGEVSCCVPIFDPEGTLAKLKTLIATYPEPLRDAAIQKYLFDAGFELAIADKPAARGDIMYVTGCLFRAAGFMTLVVYALNRRWWLNEKGALAEARGFAVLPDHFAARIETALAAPGGTPAELGETIAALQGLLADLTRLAAR